MNVIVMGAPGTGKGTYSSRLAKYYGVPHISTGDLFREHQKNKTEIGMKIQDFLNHGKLVPDEITIEIVKERIAEPDCESGFIMDGFPRTVSQAEALEKITKIDTVIYFLAENEVIINRITGRRTCTDCGSIHHVKNIPMKQEGKCNECEGDVVQREDEKPHIVKDRLKIYEEKTKPLVQYYKEKGLLHEVDANLDINHPEFTVIDDCKKIMDELK